jgi:hypothetical protein
LPQLWLRAKQSAYFFCAINSANPQRGEVGLGSTRAAVRIRKSTGANARLSCEDRANDSQERFESLGVDVFHGEARFVSPHEIEIIASPSPLAMASSSVAEQSTPPPGKQHGKRQVSGKGCMPKIS